ncbi:cell wall protein PRY3-like [Melanotaenia boesemani]|uniref:cell wall protein PRY3-like n=1 Tax=Melanotaenia boesemani TaxID=1250792 RepID=UPI001C050F09|nr:cell wall protein PRY3-like [Melanotaenia boesemani]
MADGSFQKEFLDTHNAYRAMHNAPPLTYNSELNAAAQKWADHLLKKNSLGHSNTKDGENVYYKSSTASVSPKGKEAVDSWYSEIKDYDFGRPGFRSNTGHFTQVVWKDSKELGVGMATDGKKVFVVGQYRPAGNFTNPGYFEKNVSPKDESFQKEFLDTHNAYRAMHNAPPLTYNSELNAAAQKWADHMLGENTLGHSDTNDGENIYFMSSSASVSPTGKEAVDSWYSEIKDYDFNKPGFQSKTGHFTQVVWKDSKELGVGMATDGKKVIVVGQYRPAGNIANPGHYEKNISPKE